MGNKLSLSKLDLVEEINMAETPLNQSFDESTIKNALDDSKLDNIESKKIKEKTIKNPLKNSDIKKSKFGQIIQAFDVVDRFGGMIESKRATTETGAFDIIRILSMCMVIFGHEFLLRSAKNADFMNIQGVLERNKYDWNITLAVTCLYSVDIFLFMGGYVSILSSQRIINDFKNCRFWKIPILYLFILIKRYVRIFPVVLVIV